MFIVFVVLLPDLRIESDKKEGLNTQLMNNWRERGSRKERKEKGRKGEKAKVN